MKRLRTRLLVVFLAATLVPVAVTLAITWRLLEHSVRLNPTRELDAASHALELTGRALYQTAREGLRAEVNAHTRQPSAVYDLRRGVELPPEIKEFAESGERRTFRLGGDKQDRVEYLVRNGDRVLVYSRPIAGPGMKALAAQFMRSRAVVERASAYDFRRGFTLTLILVAAAVWTVSFVSVLYLAQRISRPMEELTSGLGRLAAGDLKARLQPKGTEEVAAAMLAFNHTAAELSESQDKLVHVTRLSSWQTLARKMAHELKNSLTPIRLTVEEIAARRADRDEAFFEQAAQIVVDEISTLERRVRAFSELSSEPPVQITDVNLNTLFEERLALLRAANPAVVCNAQLSAEPVRVRADADLLKSVLSNLLDNAAYAAGSGGVVLARVFVENGMGAVEIHDSGPGLSALARSTLFEPTISFRKAGMGLGLSIARRSAMLVGGDIMPVEGELGGAAFRVVLPRVEEDGIASRNGSG